MWEKEQHGTAKILQCLLNTMLNVKSKIKHKILLEIAYKSSIDRCNEFSNDDNQNSVKDFNIF